MTDATIILTSDEARGSDGTGGLKTNAEMLRLIDQPGYISLEMGGQRLRSLYQQFFARFNANMLSEFALCCFLGQVEQIERLMFPKNAKAINPTGTETPYKFGYCTFVIAGAQRGAADRPGSDHAGTLRLLLMFAAPVDSEDIVGNTALHHAMQNPTSSALALARIMLSVNANRNHRNRFGEVPLFGALQADSVDAVELLSAFSADMDIADADGVPPRALLPRAGPRITALTMTWLRRHTDETAPMEENRCAQCGKAVDRLMVCELCNAMQYCSATCFSVHWPTHKRTCQPFNDGPVVTVRPRYQAAEHMLSTADTMHELLGVRTEARPAQGRGVHAPSLRPGESKMLIIKVQVPMSLYADGLSTAMPSGDILVYTKNRDFVCLISKADNAYAYARISHTVREKGVGGLKAYLQAKLNGEDELVVKIGEVLAEQPF